jgi:hypothetical protein
LSSVSVSINTFFNASASTGSDSQAGEVPVTAVDPMLSYTHVMEDVVPPNTETLEAYVLPDIEKQDAANPVGDSRDGWLMSSPNLMSLVRKLRSQVSKQTATLLDHMSRPAKHDMKLNSDDCF